MQSTMMLMILAAVVAVVQSQDGPPPPPITCGTDNTCVSSNQCRNTAWGYQCYPTSQATPYKLQYFDIRGRGEFIRYMFHYRGVPFVDEHVGTDKWPIAKPTMPMGQLPVLTVGDRRMAQTAAIGAYAGALLNLNGADDYDAARCVMIAGGIEDQATKFFPITMARLSNNETGWRQLTREYEADGLKVWAERHEGFINDNGGQFLVGNAVSWADIYVAEFMGRMYPIAPAAFGATPRLLALYNSIVNSPGVSQYIQTRLDHPM